MKKILLVIVATLVSACQSYSLGRYTPAVDNQLYLRGLAPAQINVSEFTATTPDDKDIFCVGRIFIRTQDDETFAKFIQNALTSELKLAGIYSPNAKTTLSGKLQHIDASYHRSQWEMTLTITSSNGKSATFSFNQEDCNFTGVQSPHTELSNMFGFCIDRPKRMTDIKI